MNKILSLTVAVLCCALPAIAQPLVGSKITRNGPLANALVGSGAVYVSAALGDDGNSAPGPYATLTYAQSVASAGQTIYVLDGTFAETGLGKEGVKWNFADGVIINGGAAGAFLVGATNSTTGLTILGSGQFTNSVVNYHFATNVLVTIFGRKTENVSGGNSFAGFYTTGNSNRLEATFTEDCTGPLAHLDVTGNPEYNTNRLARIRVFAPKWTGRVHHSISIGNPSFRVIFNVGEYRQFANGTLNVNSTVVFERGYWSRAGSTATSIGTNIWFKGVSCVSSNTDASAAIFSGVHGTFYFEDERTLISNP
jgi:hypothetical protein